MIETDDKTIKAKQFQLLQRALGAEITLALEGQTRDSRQQQLELLVDRRNSGLLFLMCALARGAAIQSNSNSYNNNISNNINGNHCNHK
ncbi:uncharacterized protein Dmoj_GI26674 [Drosophila mojavensis]|uniref:Uncharacterized protein n=1 Tax=Drosophila mojavensis TaxID=7230 RepID=A0A0Q9XGT1_DROMO|nr:uncharacterized protein Dmoj_GI26674 [Drosophila mojavensis]